MRQLILKMDTSLDGFVGRAEALPGWPVENYSEESGAYMLDLISSGAVGLGLGVVASPLAAVLAFVDPGDAKSAACGPVLTGANAAAMRTTKGKARDDVGTGKRGEVAKVKKEG